MNCETDSPASLYMPRPASSRFFKMKMWELYGVPGRRARWKSSIRSTMRRPLASVSPVGLVRV